MIRRSRNDFQLVTSAPFSLHHTAHMETNVCFCLRLQCSSEYKHDLMQLYTPKEPGRSLENIQQSLFLERTSEETHLRNKDKILHLEPQGQTLEVISCEQGYSRVSVSFQKLDSNQKVLRERQRNFRGKAWASYKAVSTAGLWTTAPMQPKKFSVEIF